MRHMKSFLPIPCFENYLSLVLEYAGSLFQLSSMGDVEQIPRLYNRCEELKAECQAMAEALLLAALSDERFQAVRMIFTLLESYQRDLEDILTREFESLMDFTPYGEGGEDEDGEEEADGDGYFGVF